MTFPLLDEVLSSSRGASNSQDTGVVPELRKVIHNTNFAFGICSLTSPQNAESHNTAARIFVYQPMQREFHQAAAEIGWLCSDNGVLMLVVSDA